ncbi:MAG: hypothetical protein RL110_1415 [Bacteroidota bacterium]|jgi:hypothetical protein
MNFLRLIFLLVIVGLHSHLMAQGQILSLSGYYEGKNLFVSNPIKADGYGFCIHKVLVNGNVLPAAIHVDYFEIDFSLFNLKKGEEVFIELEHSEGCTPKFVNSEAVLPFSTFEMISLNASSDGKITWQDQNESGKISFLVEQYKWGRWVVAAEVMGSGSKSASTYTIEIVPTSGLNKIRIAQIDHTGVKRVSKTVSFTSKLKEVFKSPAKVKNVLYFKTKDAVVKTKYEIYDAFGNLLKKGYANSVDCSDLLNGVYNVNYDQKTEKFIKY